MQSHVIVGEREGCDRCWRVDVVVVDQLAFDSMGWNLTAFIVHPMSECLTPHIRFYVVVPSGAAKLQPRFWTRRMRSSGWFVNLFT